MRPIPSFEETVRKLASSVVFAFTDDGRGPLGTAFVVSYPVPGQPNKAVPLIITAKHVVGNLGRVSLRWSRAGGGTGAALYDIDNLRTEGDVWEHHDDGVDLIVFRTPHLLEAEYFSVPFEAIASRETYGSEELKATDRVMLPSLLLNFFGSSRNYPVLREGSIALIPDEPIPYTFEFGPRTITTSQPLVLLNAMSIPGASGSPVFLNPIGRVRANQFSTGGTAWLLGINLGHYSTPDGQHTGMSLMLPSWRLLEVLDETVRNRIQSITMG